MRYRLMSTHTKGDRITSCMPFSQHSMQRDQHSARAQLTGCMQRISCVNHLQSLKVTTSPLVAVAHCKSFGYYIYYMYCVCKVVRIKHTQSMRAMQARERARAHTHRMKSLLLTKLSIRKHSDFSSTPCFTLLLPLYNINTE